MTQEEIVLLDEMIDIGDRMFRQGFVAANDGNISVRVPDGIWATPTGVSKGGMTRDMFVKLSLNGEILEGSRRPSSEIKMHLRLYNENPAICAAVHAHPLYATSFAIAGLPLDEPIYPAMMMNLGPIPLAPYSPPGTQGVADSVAPFAHTSRACLLQSHGALTWAHDLRTAWYRMEELENFARLTFNTVYVMKAAKPVPWLAPLGEL